MRVAMNLTEEARTARLLLLIQARGKMSIGKRGVRAMCSECEESLKQKRPM